MQQQNFVTLEDVAQACQALGLCDWSQMKEPRVLAEEAAIIRKEVGAEALNISVEAFRRGLEVELEHGRQFSDSNVTNNHPILTGKIVLAHLKETLDYYTRLEVAELEGDAFKALQRGDGEKLTAVYRRLISARRELASEEQERLAGERS
jgi:hypothetical protein